MENGYSGWKWESTREKERGYSGGYRVKKRDKLMRCVYICGLKMRGGGTTWEHAMCVDGGGWGWRREGKRGNCVWESGIKWWFYIPPGKGGKETGGEW